MYQIFHPRTLVSRAGFVAIISVQVVIQPSYQLLSHEFRKVLNHHFLTELGKVRIVSDRALPGQTPAVSSALKTEGGDCAKACYWVQGSLPSLPPHR